MDGANNPRLRASGSPAHELALIAGLSFLYGGGATLTRHSSRACWTAHRAGPAARCASSEPSWMAAGAISGVTPQDSRCAHEATFMVAFSFRLLGAQGDPRSTNLRGTDSDRPQRGCRRSQCTNPIDEGLPRPARSELFRRPRISITLRSFAAHEPSSPKSSLPHQAPRRALTCAQGVPSHRPCPRQPAMPNGTSCRRPGRLTCRGRLHFRTGSG